jgi:hypothetical protein
MVSCADARVPAPAATQPSQLPEISIALLASVEKVTGMPVPANVKTDRSSFRRLEPAMVEVLLPEGKSFSLPVGTFFVMTSSGVVTDIGLRRRMEAESFKDVLRDIKVTLNELGIKPDDQMQRDLRTWEDAPVPDAGAGRYVFKTGTPAYPHVNLQVQVRPHGDGGWYALLQFGVDADGRRYLWDSAATRPTFAR